MGRRKGQRYISYLLRLWRVAGRAGPEWRASLQSVEGNETHGFGNLQELFAYLLAVAGQEGAAEEASDGPPAAG